MKYANRKKVKRINQLKKKKKFRKFTKSNEKNCYIFYINKYSILYKLLTLLFMIIFLSFNYNVPQKDEIMDISLFNSKVCICTLGKEENKYIIEFIEYYKNMGVDKIYLYDINNIDGEHFEEVIDNYIKSGFVEIVDCRGKKSYQMQIVKDCYKKNHMNYDWLIFYDIDEYIHLKGHNIKSYLNQSYFNNCEVIYLNWILHTDNNKFYYENKTLKERFPEIQKDFNTLMQMKSILRGHIPKIRIENNHLLSNNLKKCDGYGRPPITEGFGTYNIDHTNYYIDHYSCKSTEELVKKINKGSAYYHLKNRFDRLKIALTYNEITQEKIDYFDKNIPGFSNSSVREELIKRIKNK